MVTRSKVLIAGYVLMLAFGVGFIICCWMGTAKTNSAKDGFLMTWNSVMMLCTLLQMLYWRVLHAGSNLYVGITLSMMGFMSLQAVVAAATYVDTSKNDVYDDAIGSFAILYAFTTICHIALMALWRHGGGEFDGEDGEGGAPVFDKKDYEQVTTST
mmetsp:Transcript_25980/g.41827  ORF Transcript_25980/g.41827 Transcript_25980/m.41827 type:complete len:157 (+) Transcript_25980:55-525(+)